jgi:hypothetical protein
MSLASQVNKTGRTVFESGPEQTVLNFGGETDHNSTSDQAVEGV